MITPFQFSEMQARLSANSKQSPLHTGSTVAAEKETGKNGLQQQIKNWCDAQWPRWVCDFPRTDMKSTLPLGRHDATVWGPFPICILIETKARGKKRSPDQLIWKTRMEAIGWTVHLVYSFEEFIALAKYASGK